MVLDQDPVDLVGHEKAGEERIAFDVESGQNCSHKEYRICRSKFYHRGLRGTETAKDFNMR